MKKKLNFKSLFKKAEWSKIITSFVSLICMIYAIWSGIKYYELVKLAIEMESSVMPDATLPITGITGLLGSILSYLSYQAILKSSLNKNKLKIDKAGVVRAISNNDANEIISMIEEAQQYIDEDQFEGE